MSPADVPPVIWREALDDGRGLDELAPASTARPWVLVEAVEVRRPRRAGLWAMWAMFAALAGGAF